tara:strand:- start:2497 stop:3717 length:1221 start_codon:yes stop_codon:yes gene_type:complete
MSVRKDKERGGYIADLGKFGGKRNIRVATKAEADAIHAQAAEEFRITGSYISRSGSPTFAQVAEEFLEHQATNRLQGRHVAAGEIANKRTNVRHLNKLPYRGSTLAETKVADIRLGEVQNTLVPALFAKRANKTNRNIFAVFGQVIKFAMVAEYLLHDPLMVNQGNNKTGIELPLPDEADKIDAIGERISKSIINQILDAAGPALDAPIDLGDDDEQVAMRKYKRRFFARLLIAVGRGTGIRAGEQAALRWPEVHLDRGVIDIKFSRKKDGTIGRPKTKAGVRQIELAPDLVAALRVWKALQPAKEAANGYVFANEDGNMNLDNSNWRNRVLHAACDKAGVERIRWHDLRHFFASVLIFDLQETEIVIASVMGHKNAAFTREQYGHWLDDVKPTTGMGGRLAAVMS